MSAQAPTHAAGSAAMRQRPHGRLPARLYLHHGPRPPTAPFLAAPAAALRTRIRAGTAAATFTFKITSDPGLSAGSGICDATASAPSPPTSVTATAGDGAATVAFAPGADGGAAITGYTVTSIPGGAGITSSCSVATLNCTVTGLTNFVSYTFTVTATNSVGASSASAPSAPVMPTARA